MKIRYTCRGKLAEAMAVEILRLVLPRASTAQIYTWRNETKLSSYCNIAVPGEGRCSFDVCFWVDGDKSKAVHVDVTLHLDLDGKWVPHEAWEHYIIYGKGSSIVDDFQYKDGEFVLVKEYLDFPFK